MLPRLVLLLADVCCWWLVGDIITALLRVELFLPKEAAALPLLLELLAALFLLLLITLELLKFFVCLI
jgi:hypothetical protein